MVRENEELFLKLNKDQQLQIIRTLLSYQKCYVVEHVGGGVSISSACLIDNEVGKRTYVLEDKDFDFSGQDKYITPWYMITKKYCESGVDNNFAIDTCTKIFNTQVDYMCELVWERWMNKTHNQNK